MKELQKQEFTLLVEKNQGILFKVARMYTNGDAACDDLIQDILLQLWRAFESFNGKSKFSTWMYRVALNTAISQYRKKSRQTVELTHEIPSVINDDDFQQKTESEKLLHQAIGKLSKVEKSIIILYMDDYPYDEIAEIIGVTKTNIGVKINRIKTKLQTILNELGYGL